jgi:hypothetical protein
MVKEKRITKDESNSLLKEINQKTKNKKNKKLKERKFL